MPEATVAPDPQVDAFIARWERAEAAERANYQMFLAELCELLAVAPPDPSGADNAFNQYVFDRAITRSKPLFIVCPIEAANLFLSIPC